MADLLLYAGPDGGEIESIGGVLTLDESPRTAVYLSLFGGNLDDDGTEATKPKQWWANWGETEEPKRLRSRTQALLLGMPASPSNLIRVEEAVKADLNWLTEEVASALEVSVSMPARNRVRIQIQIEGRSHEAWSFDFTQPWGPQ